MRSKAGIPLSLFLISIILCGALITNVNASTKIALGEAQRSLYTNAIGAYQLRVDRPQLRLLSHSSGKIIVLSVDSSSHLFVKVISSTGVILAITQITTPATIEMCGSIAEYDTNNVIITCDGTAMLFYFILFNINTYTQTPYYLSWGTGGGNEMFKIGQLYYYNGVWYTPVYVNRNTSEERYFMCKFTKATLTTSKTAFISYSDASNGHEIMGFQDLNNLKMLYLVFAPTGSTPNYYSFDCSSDTFSLLATNPFADEYPDYPAYANMLTYMGGGVYQSGTYYYMYHSWCFSFLSGGTTGIREVKTVHWTGEFNNSITSSTLLSQVRKEQISIDSSSSSSNASGINWGYLHITVGASSQDVYAYYQDIYGGKYISRDTLHITDLTTMSGTFDSINTLKGVDNIDFTYKSYDANIGKNPMFGVSYQEVDNSNSYLYIGESATTINYTETFSYSPADAPLLTNKYYTLTWTIYKNGIIDYSGDTYQFFYDGLSMKSGALNSNGKAIISIMINVAGLHNFQIKIYDVSTAELVFSGEVYDYTVVTSTAPTGDIPSAPTLIGYYSDLFMFWLPVAIIVFIPMVTMTMLGARYAGGAGAIVGMIFGGATGMIGGTVTGIIPTYALYLLVILIATAIVVLFVRGSSGGGEVAP